MEVFEKLEKPYFTLDESRPAMEDVVICEKAREAGYDIWCDPTIKIGHIGTYIY
jgi:GT2 family glycosyltransferase